MEASRILKMVEATKEQHPRSKIVLTIEIRISTTIPTRKPQLSKRKVLEMDEEASSLITSSPPNVQERKKKSRTSVLEAQQAIRLDKIQLADDFERQLADRLLLARPNEPEKPLCSHSSAAQVMGSGDFYKRCHP